MKTAVLIVLVLAASAETSDAADNLSKDEKTCIFLSAEALPKVPDLKIKASRFKLGSTAASNTVEFDVTAAGVEATLLSAPMRG